MDSYAYLGLSKPRRFLFKTRNFFVSIPKKTLSFFKSIPSKFVKIGKKVSKPFIEIKDALVYGDWKTRLSFIFMGFGLFTRKEFLKGILFFLFEIIFGLFMGFWGWKYLSKFGSLGTELPHEVWDEATQSFIYVKGDNSLLILLYGTVCLVVILGFIYTYYQNIKSSYKLQQISNVGGKIETTKDVFKSLADREYHKTLLAIPMLGLVTFTIIPLIFMIFIAFTNWDKGHLPPEHLFTWSGVSNFDILLGKNVLGENAKFAYTFKDALLWTLVWAFFATFSNYFLGMILALVINKKGIKFKKFWRTILVTTIAVPQFVSLLLISQMFSSGGIVNHMLELMGLPKLVYAMNTVWARIFVIIINIWVGVPYTVLSCTGILMNIPNDLYESARIDGAGPFKMYMKITLPYMMFVMGPYLISQFIGNINNFNVIFLLTGGVPVNSDKLIGGDTDLLITWLYKLTVNENNYKMASAIGIVVFIIVAVISMIFYSKSNAVKNEEDFQ